MICICGISGSTWQASNMLQSSILAAYGKDKKPITNRGFTGHEMLDEVGIIHMNGRIYDASLGRFLQADPFIQDPTSAGSLNRYSYLMNNPLNGVDPSGYFSFKRLWKEIRPFAGVIVGAVLVVASGGTLAAPATSWFLANAGTAALLGGITGAVGAAANGGNVLKGTLFGAISGAAFFGVGEVFKGALSGLQGAGEFFAKTAMHGSVGGVLSVLQEGKFGHGFVGAGVAKGFSLLAQSLDTGVVGEFMSATLAGGTVSDLTGGKFANGAQTAAIAYLVNAAAHKGAEGAQGGLAQKNEEMMAALRPFAESGDFKGFWEVARSYGDPLAQLALDFHDGLYGATLPNSYAISSLELNWSRAFSNGERLHPELLQALKSTVGKNLMLKHYDSLKTDINLNIGTPGNLSVQQVDQYHYDYFESLGLPKHTCGGFGVHRIFYCRSCDPVSQ